MWTGPPPHAVERLRATAGPARRRPVAARCGSRLPHPTGGSNARRRWCTPSHRTAGGSRGGR
ncbi:hypothetical protein HMPREF0591_0694 [Mycobacterium parascrofulaceum ATCC BAA-614]|uniref:Uncharacterized protein n=1 Tax=Mycobacterium parascrofulaceum ATCC BAA-614 TaxID=525368 RepID=D5P3F0_9MYCO|nr:hypothetical protein HMPREF0591_0694 [Mycobacterium parascrofulaceum ATCC BAA-614]